MLRRAFTTPSPERDACGIASPFIAPARAVSVDSTGSGQPRMQLPEPDFEGGAVS